MGTTCGRQSEQIFCTCTGDWIRGTADGTRTHELYEFDMGSILHGQLWRVVTWIFTPTASLDVFGILFLFCVLMWGSSLESMLGTFRMNVFLWGSVILCDIVGAIVYVVTRILLGYGFSPYLSTYYILMSMLLALAMCMPEGEVRLYFVLPIRMKWMLILNWYIWDIRWFVYSRSELQVMEPEWESLPAF